MYNPEHLIKRIEDKCCVFFLNSTFNFLHKPPNKWKLGGGYQSKAILRDFEEVNVLKWFDDFWVYLELEFEVNSDSFPRIFITLSVFQGEENDEVKNHLFRAEWDNYDGNEIHPQPHWHIYPVRYDRKVQEDFETFIEIKEEESFEDIVSPSNNKIIDVKKIHFAMNANWSFQKSHIHKINSEDSVIYWLQGLISHIKEQLEYVTN